jgi:hypothetical protein
VTTTIRTNSGAATPSATLPLTPKDLEDLRKGIFEEYKLIEEKIDRIGEFLFKIRAWNITANSGLIIAIASDKVTFWMSLIGICATFGFWKLERYQRFLRDGYSDRALTLEAALEKITAAYYAKHASARLITISVAKSLSSTPSMAKSSVRRYDPAELRNSMEDWYIYFPSATILISTFLFKAIK